MTLKSSKPLESQEVRHVGHVVRFIAYARANNTQKTPLGTEPEDLSHLSQGSFLGVARCGGRGAPVLHAFQKFWNRESNFSVPETLEFLEILELGERHDRL